MGDGSQKLLNVLLRIGPARRSSRLGGVKRFKNIDEMNAFGADGLPGLVGLRFTAFDEGWVTAELSVHPNLMAPNGYLHAASVVALADTACGYGCIASMPDGALGFTTVELKSNFVGTARDGVLLCKAECRHGGRTTQVWDATITHQDTGKTTALFRCTQFILWPK